MSQPIEIRANDRHDTLHDRLTQRTSRLGLRRRSHEGEELLNHPATGQESQDEENRQQAADAGRFVDEES
jgi:hypothetical protein